MENLPTSIDMTGVFVVVPAYNEMPAIQDVLTELSAVVPNVVVVDDGSSDGTYEASCGLARWTLRHLVNRGQGAALQTGIEFALRLGAEFIVTFDADGQHRVEDIVRIVAPLRRGECDVALGSRFLGAAHDLPRSRRLAIKVAVALTRLVNRLKVTDVHNGLRAFSRRAAGRIHITLDRMAHASEILDIIARLGLPYCEVPVEIRYTDYSLRKGQKLSDAPRILVHYLIGRTVE